MNYLAISLPSPKVLPSVFVLLKSDVAKIQPKTKIEPFPASAAGPHHSLMENLWCKIFSFLSTRDRASIAATCKPFQRFGTVLNLTKEFLYLNLVILDISSKVTNH